MIEILDSFFAKKDILRKYTYAQYIDCFREVGTFEIHAQLVDENIYLLDKTEQYYVLFYDGNKPILGKIEDVKRESDEQYDIVIKLTGRLAPVLFTQRVINGTQKFSGKTYQRVQTLVNSNLIQSDKTERNVDITINLLNETVMQEKASQEDKQVTGGYVWDEMQGSLETDSFGIDFYPVLSTPTGEHKTNIASWVLDISPGNDRRKGNAEGNIPVVFSQQLSNIERTDYDRNVKNHRNVAYVAGEGEDENRKWYEIDINQDIEQKTNTGWGRKELWIDARDIQGKDEDGTDLTETEYEALITQRANEKAADNTVQETYEATKTEGDTRYQYGVDFFKGDWVTVEDRNLNIVVDAQITKVTHTIQGTREIVDITFSYGQIDKDPVEQIGGNLDKTEQNSNDIKYLENVVLTTEPVLLCETDYGDRFPAGSLSVYYQLKQSAFLFDVLELHCINNNGIRSVVFVKPRKNTFGSYANTGQDSYVYFMIPDRTSNQIWLQVSTIGFSDDGTDMYLGTGMQLLLGGNNPSRVHAIGFEKVIGRKYRYSS